MSGVPAVKFCERGRLGGRNLVFGVFRRLVFVSLAVRVRLRPVPCAWKLPDVRIETLRYPYPLAFSRKDQPSLSR